MTKNSKKDEKTLKMGRNAQNGRKVGKSTQIDEKRVKGAEIGVGGQIGKVVHQTDQTSAIQK